MLLFLVSLILRIPYFIEYPVFRSDEIYENIWARMILVEKKILLTNTVPFIGSLYNYLALIPYAVLRASWSPRLLVLFTGSLTVIILYLLVEKIFDKKLALLSTILLVFSPPHILIASRVAWSASLSPFFLICSIYLMVNALEKDLIKYWFLAGLFIGLTLQSHPSTIASYVGLIIGLLYYYRDLSFLKRIFVKTRFFFILLGFTIGYLNMIIYNVFVDPFGSIEYVFQAKWTGVSSGLTLPEYLRRISFLFIEYFSMYPSGIPVITLPYYLNQPLFYIYSATFILLFITAILCSREARLLAIYLLTTILILGIGTRGAMAFNIFGFAWGPHYLVPLIPLSTILLGIGLRNVYNKIRDLKLGSVLEKIIAVFMVFMVILWPYLNFYGILVFMDKNNYTNNLFLKPIHVIKEEYSGVPVFIIYSDLKKNPALSLFHYISVLEELNVYPRISFKTISDLRYLLRLNNSTELKKYIMDWMRKSFIEYYREVKDNGCGLLVVDPSEPSNKTRSMLEYFNLTIIGEYIVDVNNKPVYKIIVVRLKD